MAASRSGSRRDDAVVAGRREVSLAEPLLDSAAAAALLNVRVSWVRDAARLGQLPCLRVGRHLRFTALEHCLLGPRRSESACSASCAGGACYALVLNIASRQRGMLLPAPRNGPDQLPLPGETSQKAPTFREKATKHPYMASRPAIGRAG
jgi:hypothetical protein